MKNEIVIFTLNNCGFCQSLKKRLTSHKIEFKEVEISQNPQLWDKIVEETGEDYVPTVFIRNGDKDDGRLYSPDKDFKDENEIFLIILKSIPKLI